MQRRNHNLLRMEFQEGLGRGIAIFVNGKELSENSMEGMARRMDQDQYMRDFVANQEGKIVSIHYDKIE